MRLRLELAGAVGCCMRKFDYRETKGHNRRNGSTSLGIRIGDQEFREIRSLAKSRRSSVSSTIRELLEFALLELEDQGEIYLGRHKVGKEARQ